MPGTATLQRHPTARIGSTTRVSAAVLALLAAVAIALVLAFSGGGTDDAAVPNVGAAPALRSDGGPSETAVAASVSGRTSSPDEAAIAAAVGGR